MVEWLEPIIGTLLVVLFIWEDRKRQKAMEAWRKELQQTKERVNAYLLEEASRLPSY